MSTAAEDSKIETKEIWLLLLKEGGWWGAGEIANELGGHYDYVCRVIYQMCTRGYLKRHERVAERIAYSVDKTCKVPLKLKVSDLIEAGAL